MSLSVAVKFFDEIYFTNEFYSRVGGISLKEFNSLEIEFLTMIEYNLFVDENTFLQYREKLSLYKI